MPNRNFHQTMLQDQVTSTSPKFESSTVGKTESEVFEYFGFLQINGKWVDPDSEKAMYDALKRHPDITHPLLPGMDVSSGPYILSKSEQSILYAQFVDDEDDNEGDPRAFRISAETFALWAEGTVKGQQLQHEVIKQPVSKPKLRHKMLMSFITVLLIIRPILKLSRTNTLCSRFRLEGVLARGAKSVPS
jgi:hypothetical protein